MVAYTGTRALDAKRGGARLALLLAILAAFAALAFAPAPALADDEVTNDEIMEVMPLDGSATVENLPDGQIQITVSSTNDSGQKVPGHLVEFEAPEGYELVSGSLKSAVQTTEDGGTLSTTAVFKKASGKKDDGGSGSGDADSKKNNGGDTGNGGKADGAKKGALPRTGDTLAYAGVAIVCVCGGVLFIMAAKKLRFKGMVLIVATVALVAASYPVPMLQAFADEAGAGNTVEYEVQDDATEGGEDATSLCDTPVTGTKTLDLSAGDQKVSVDAKVTFLVDGEHESASTVNVDTSDTIATGARSAWVTLESTVPFTGTKTETEDNVDSKWFDVSKLTFSGALEGATVRGGTALAQKSTEDDEYAQNNISGDDKTHYELTLQLDDIPETKANEENAESDIDDYGYINFAEGSFVEDEASGTDEDSTGLACVTFKTPEITIPEIDSTEKIGNDSMSHALDKKGNYWAQYSYSEDDTPTITAFNIPFDFSGALNLSAVRDDTPGYDKLVGDAETIDGDDVHTYKGLDGDNVIDNISFVDTCGADIEIASYDDKDYNLWVNFEVKETDLQKAYDELTAALSKGVRFNGILLGGAPDAIAYPADMDATDASVEGASGFTYAESNPTAVMWATDYEMDERDGGKTTITYLASVRSASDLIGEDDGLADVDLKEGKTTFDAKIPEVTVSEDTETTTVSDTSLDEGYTEISGMEIESVEVAGDGGDDVMKLKVTVPTAEFKATLETLGLDDDGSDESFNSLYSYVSGLDLRMSNGSTNAFGVADVNEQVEIIDGSSLMSDLSETDGAATVSDGQDEGETATTPKTVAEVKSATDDISKMVKEIACDEVKSIAKTAVESGKKIFEAVTKIIKAYTASGGASLSMLGPVGTILGAAVGLVSAFNFSEKSTTYSINDVMDKLEKLESTVNGISANTSVITLSLQEMDNSIAYSDFEHDLGSLHSYMSGNQLTGLITTLQDELGKYEDTTDAHAACTLATPLKDMPEEAITLVRKFVAYGNKYARLQTGKEDAEAALQQLYNMIEGNGFAHNKNLIDAYFSYTENFYNWESETYTVRLAFIATLTQMWYNAYLVANADVALQAYDLDKNGDPTSPDYALDQKDKVETANKLETQTDYVMEALYGSYDWAALEADFPADDADTQAAGGETTYVDGTKYDLSKIKTSDKYKDEYESKFEEYKKEYDNEEDAAAQAIQDILNDHYYSETTSNGSAAAIKRTHSDGTGTERLLVVESSTTVSPVTFSTTYDDDQGNTQSYYAKTAAYNKSCFAESYMKKVIPASSSDDIIDLAKNSSWSANSSFKAWQITQMVKRLNALPDALRPAITTTDSSGKEVRKAVENIDEELQALGFKSVNTAPSTNYKAKLVGIDKTNSSNYKLSEALYKYGVVDAGTADNPTSTDQEVALDKDADENQNWSFVLTYAGYNEISTESTGGYKYGAIKQGYWVELGSSADRLLSVGIGDRIENSGDWVITQSGSVVKGPRDRFWNWHSKARYGTVVNYKTGAVKENQLLYNFDTEYYESLVRWYQYGNWFKRLWNRIADGEWINRVEFYGFGVFDLTAKSGKIETGSGTGYNDHNVYKRADNITQYLTNRYRVEGSYWTVDSDGRLYPTVEGVTDKTSRTDPTGVYTYKKEF